VVAASEARRNNMPDARTGLRLPSKALQARQQPNKALQAQRIQAHL